MRTDKLVPWLIAAAVIVFAVWRRRQQTQTPSKPTRASTQFPAFLTGGVGLIAAREIRQRARGRTFRVVTALMLLGVAAAIVVPVLTKSGPATARIGAVGALSVGQRAAVAAAGTAVGTAVVVVPEANQSTANSDLSAGRISLEVLDARQVVTNDPIDTGTSTTARLARAVAATLGEQQAFQAAGLTVSQAATLARSGPIPVTSLHPQAYSGAARTTAVLGLVLLLAILTQYNTWTMIGVMEEKSSRVIEVLLATVRPLQLLSGKVLGIGLLVFAQAGLVVGFALALSAAVGSSFLQGTTPVTALLTLAWLVLGYAFYSWVYAAAGSLAERQEQVQSLALPLGLPILFGYVVSLTVLSSGNPSTLFDILAYLPPTAPFAMPTLVALGAASWWQVAASALISVACTIGVARLAALVYQRAVLRTGRRVRLREVLARQTR